MYDWPFRFSAAPGADTGPPDLTPAATPSPTAPSVDAGEASLFSRLRRTLTPSMTPAGRVFLVVVDDSEECLSAVRFAATRANRTGGTVTLLSVSSVPDFHHWMFVGSLMREEQRLRSEERLSECSMLVRSLCGHAPEVIVREGDPHEELLRVLDRDTRISVLVLAAAGAGPDGPGPLITALTGKQATPLKIPVTIVPGSLTAEQMDAMA